MKIILTFVAMCVLGCRLQAQVSFVLSSSPGVGVNPESVVAADVNGDGKLDLISANVNGNSLSVLTNNGSGGFALSSSPGVGSFPASVVAADVNGDGKLDLICANAFGNTVSVVTNNGSGGFVTAGTYAVGNVPASVVAADVNGDGRPDLICANQNGNTLSVLTNDGSGGFVLSSSPGVGNVPWSVVAADVNGDGKMDLICANEGGNSLSVLTNDGSGGFATAGTYVVGSNPESVIAADVNGDGRLDLICANATGNTLSVLTNNGSGGFVLASSPSVGSYPISVTAADVNGDGKLDLICANLYGNSLSVLTNDGSGGFTLAASPSVGSNPSFVTAADVNGDGRVDLISANTQGNNLSVLTNTTPTPSATTPPIITSFTPQSGTVGTTVTLSGTNFSATAAADIVYFGAVQANVLAASPTSLQVTVPVGATFAPITVTVNGLIAYADQPFLPTFPGNGQTSFTLSSTLSPGAYPQCVTAADVKGDGKLELISANSNDNTVSVLTNNGSGGFAVAHIYAVGSNPYFVLTADVNGDGKLDLICANENGNTISVLTNNGTGGFVLASSPGVGNHPYGITAADINGDGKVDLISANTSDNTLSVLMNNGSGGFVLASSPGVGNAPVSVVAADVNGDGKLDLICANSSDNTLSVLTNNGNGGFALANTYAVGNNPRTVVTADVNGDGKLDLICANFNNSTLSILTNNGSGGFVLAASPGVGSNPYGLTAADANGDGKVDLISANFNNTLSVLTNDGSGNFVLALSPSVGGGAECVVAADVNGDGKVDLISANAYSSSLSVLTNTTLFITQTTSITPVITSFTPQSGTVGTTVTLSGTNFSATAAADIVYFGAVQANVLAASPTSLQVTVPVGATFAPITVTVNGLIAYADQPFLPTFPGNGQINNSSLAPRVDLPTGNGPGKDVIADLDGDGKPDLISADAYSGEISIYRNISTNGSLTAGSFAPRVDLPLLPSGGSSPYTIVAADLDGDGRPDLIVLNPDYNVVSILRNISSPGSITTNSFAARMDLPAGNVMRGLAVQDLNGDGKPEIVTANYGDNGISVFQNMSTIGNIAFAARVNVAAGNGSVGVAIGDLDGDGQPDLAVANYNDGTISVFRNLGVGGNITTSSFAPKVDFPALTSVFPIAIGDMDGDGKLDLVVGEGNGSQTVSVFRNTSTIGSITTSSLAPRVDFAAPGWVNSVALADLDGDGKLDIAVASQLSSVFSIFKNVSVPGSFTTASLAARVDYPAGYNPDGVAIGDLDGDGHPDIIFGNWYDNTISIYRNIVPIVSPGTVPVPIITSFTPQSGTVGTTVTLSGTNFSATAAADIVYFGAVQANVLAASPTSLQVTVPVGATFAPITVTVNGLIAYADQPFLPTFPGNGQTSFTLSSSPGVGVNPESVVAADVNGDGKLDLISANVNGNSLSVLTNNGSGGFALSSSPGVGSFPASVVAADVNGDGKLDLICANAFGNTVSVVTNNGSGGFVTAGTYAVGNVPASVVAADVNGDGRPDLICANQNGNTLSVLTNDGSGGFVLSSSPGVGNVPWSVVAADVNGDGKMDLICANEGGNSLSVLTNDGSGGFATAGTYVVGSNPESVIAADVNGDGRLDLICANATGNTLSVLTNNGSGGFVLASSPSVGSYPISVTAADVNGDGKLDLICANLYGNSLSVLTNDGSGGFTLAASPSVGSNPSFVTAADVNGDGRVDLISANTQGNNLSVLTNTTLLPPVANASATVPLVISVNNSNATVVLNGSLSYDLDGDPLQYAWSQTGSPNPLATGVVAVVVLPVGTNSITLTVSDGLASGQQTILVAVITLAQAVDQLAVVVNDADVSHKQSLIASLNAALGAIDRSNPTAAINQLQAFQNKVSAQISPLDPALAQTLIDEAQSIINALSAGGAASHKAMKATAQANGKIHLNFSGTHQQIYIIEASTNLVDWQMIGVAQDLGDGTFDFDDADAPRIPQRYYRVVVP